MNILNNFSGFTQWQELFDENVSKAWKEESFSDLRNISMLLFCLAREIRKVHYDMHKEALLLKAGKSKNGSGDGSLTGPWNCKSQTDQSRNYYGSVSKPPKSGTSSHDEFGSIVISEDDTHCSVETNSPEIKKKHRLKNFRRKQGGKAKRILNSASTRESLPSVSVTNASCITTENPNSHVETKQNPQVVHTPKIFQESDSTLDFSTVQSTPESTLVSNKQPIFIKQKRNRKGKQLSMVQMFSNNYRSNKTRSKSNSSDDSDRTLVTLDNTQQHQQIDSVMDITNMVSYINRESCRESINKSDIHNSNIDSIANDLTYLSSNDHIANNDASLNKTKETDNSVAKENICANLNEFLAEAQSVTCQLEAEPVVRGKERKKLPGWSCKNCEKFYLHQGLNGNQVMTLIKCSKHRGYYKPREDTLPGYWDMDLSSQENEDS